MSIEDEKNSDDIEEKIEGLSAEQEASLNALQPDYTPSTGGTENEKKPDLKTVDIVQGLLSGVFGILAGRLGEHWALSEEECKTIAVPAVQVIDKYVPDFESGPELALVTATAIVVLPRVMKQKQLNEAANDGNQSEHVAVQS